MNILDDKELKIGETVKIHGQVIKSYIKKFIMGEELKRVNQLSVSQGLEIYEKPYAFITISHAQLITENVNHTAAENYAVNCFYKNPDHPEEGNLLRAVTNNEILPWVAKRENEKLIQIFSEEELAEKTEVTLDLEVIKTLAGLKLALIGIILEECPKNNIAGTRKKDDFIPKPIDVKTLVNETEIPLHDYQVYAMNFIIDHPFCGIFLDIGLGKTLTTLAAMQELRQKGMKGHILVIAPKSIARSTWQNEIKKWHIPFKVHSFIVNENDHMLKKDERHNAYKEAVKAYQKKDWGIYLINREMIVDIVENCPWIFKTVIIDESQSFKSANTKRFKALKMVRPKINRLIELTGTPAPNGLQDLWSQIYLLDEGQRLGRSISKFREKYFTPTLFMNNHPVKWQIRPGSEKEIYQLIDDLVISVKNTTLKLPPLTQTQDVVTMPAKAKKVYEKMKKEQVLELTNGEEITAANAGVLSMRLLQLATGAIYQEDGKSFLEIHQSKLERCLYITNNTDSPCLIAYYFKSDAERLLDFYQKNGIKAEKFDGTSEMLNRWNEKKIPIMLVQPASAGSGLNFQAGGHTLIWFTLPWSLEQFQQMNGRLYRQGQKEPVIIHYVLTEGTIDKHVLQCLRKKDMSQQALLKAVKKSL